ncbi:MAG: TlpA disulfide reductase family protein [Sporomusaceae bacterium]|nr:TlpA disulfide reductase family protein [Sporomusaceae bacterium]
MNNRKRLLFLFCSLFILAGIWYVFLNKTNTPSGASGSSSQSARSGVSTGDRMPEFTLQGLAGQSVTVGKPGQISVINFWATWCPPCRAEFPELDQFARNNKDKMQFYSIDIQEDKGKVAAFLKEGNYSFTAYIDSDGAIAKQFRITAIPTTLVVDENGIIRYRKSGGVTETELEEIIKKGW